MGGTGSGRWGSHRRAVTAERCRRVDLAAVVRGRDPPPSSGELRWLRDGQIASVIGYDVVRAGPAVTLALRYRFTPGTPGAAGRDVVLDVRMERAALPRGGFRWWGRCPLAAGGVACGRRVGVLYLPPGAADFGCRRCHRLTYASRQAHDPRVTRLVKDPEALFRMARNARGASVTTLGLALKALTVLQRRNERPPGAKAGRPGRNPTWEDRT